MMVGTAIGVHYDGVGTVIGVHYDGGYCYWGTL